MVQHKGLKHWLTIFKSIIFFYIFFFKVHNIQIIDKNKDE